MADESVGSNQRAKLGRKRRVRRVKRFSSVRPKGQLSLEQAETKAVCAKAAWTGGLLSKRSEDDA